ncbi:MAG: hypothetical protein ACE366_09440 [Bradymonadia bacterium]
MMKRLFPYVLATALSLSGLSISDLSNGLVQSAAAAPSTASARSAHQAAQQALEEATAARDALATRSESLAAEIAEAKANRVEVLPGVGGGALDRKLKAAQAMGEQLQVLDREVARRRAVVDQTRTALVEAVEGEIASLRRAMSGANAEQRRQYFEALKGLIETRRDVLASATPSASPAVQLPALNGAEDASPDELRELADETRDHEERVQGRLQALESRLSALRDRRRVLQAAQDFATDSNLFGEDERNRRVASVDAQGLRPARGQRDSDNPGPVVGDDTNGRNVGGGGAEEAPTMEANDGDQAFDQPEAEAAPPPAEPGAQGEGGNDFGQQGAGDPTGDDLGADPDFDPAPVDPGTTGVVVNGGFDSAEGGAVSLSQGLDPQLLIGDVDDLSPEALADYIEKMESQRRALKRTARALQDRTADLERQADAIEGAP